MIGLLQRITGASVSVEQQSVASIDKGILVLVGIEKEDTEEHAIRLFDKLIAYRVFADADGKMNLSLADIKGELLLVPQFTLAADTRKGLRPSFSSAAPPDQGQRLFQFLLEHARRNFDKVESGVFGADMQVELTNDGPVTFWLQV